MKILFTSSRPIRNTAGLKNLKQPAQHWLAALVESLGDQLKDGGDRRIVMESEGVQIAFTLERIPGVLETTRVDLKGGAGDPDHGEIGPGHVCKHGVRWPYSCEACADAAWLDAHKGGSRE